MAFTYQKIGAPEKEYRAILYGRQTWIAAQDIPGSFGEGDSILIEERAGKYFEPTGQSFTAEILSVCRAGEDTEFLRPLHKILSLRLERDGLNRQNVKETVYEALDKIRPNIDFAQRDGVVDALDPFMDGAEILISVDAAMKAYFEAKNKAAGLWAVYEADPDAENLANWIEGSKAVEIAESRLRFRYYGE